MSIWPFEIRNSNFAKFYKIGRKKFEFYNDKNSKLMRLLHAESKVSSS